MAEWRTVALGDLGANTPAAFATGPFGSSVSAKNFRDSGIPMLRGTNLSDRVDVRLNDLDMVFVSSELASQFERAIVHPGDLVFTCWGTIGQVGIIEAGRPFDHYLISNKQMKMTPDCRQVSALFLYYYLSQPQMVELVKSQSIGSSVPGFNLGQLKNLPVRLPPIGEQQVIAEILGALDDKINANDRLIAAADELARVRYRSVADVGTPLSSLARFVNGRAFTKDATGTGRVVVRIAELNSGIGASTVYNDLEVPDDNLTRPGDLLFAWSGSLTVARWYRPEAIVNQHIFKVIPNNGVPMWLVNQAVRAKLDEFKAVAADKATTMGHIQRRHLDQPVAIPAPGAIKELDGVMDALWQRALAGEVENLSLVRTRDELLPLLMSGRLCVKGAERTVEGVV